MIREYPNHKIRHDIMDNDISRLPSGANLNPYKTLDLPITCTSKEVRVAYKKLALKHHPGMTLTDLANDLLYVLS